MARRGRDSGSRVFTPFELGVCAAIRVRLTAGHSVDGRVCVFPGRAWSEICSQGTWLDLSLTERSVTCFCLPGET